MPSWPAIAAFCTALTMLGAAVDKFLLRSSKRRLYDSLTAAWLRLDAVQVADLPALAAERALSPFELAKARSRTAYWLLTFICSVALTGTSALAGRIVRGAMYTRYDVALPVETSFLRTTLTHLAWLYEQRDRYYPEFLVNYAFDVMTIGVTVVILMRIRATKSTWTRVTLVATNLVVAVALSITCLAVSYRVLGSTISWAGLFILSADLIGSTLTLRFEPRHAPYLDDFFYAASTLLPIACYMLLLLVLVLAKTILHYARAATTYGLELATDPLPSEIDSKFSPFTLVGVLFGSLGAIAKLFSELVGNAQP